MATLRTKSELMTALADNTTGAITPSTMRDLLETTMRKPMGDISAWWDAPSANMTAGVENDFVHPSMQTHTILVIRGADNNGTTITGFDPTGVEPGEFRLLYCTSTSEEDVGNTVLAHEDSRSRPECRFYGPGQYDYTQPIGGCTLIFRGDDDRWHIVSNNGYSKRTLTQSLQLYPHMQIGTNAAPLVGTKHNWAPVGEATFGGMGIAGSDLDHRTHSYWRCYVGAAGATITGIEGGWSGPGGTLDASDFGAIKVIRNFGPGVLTIKHLGFGSEPQHQIHCPGEVDLKLVQGGTVWMIKAWYSGPEVQTNPQYVVIATCNSNEHFPSVNTVGRTTTRQVAYPSKTTLATLASAPTITSDLVLNGSEDPACVIAIPAHANGSILDGMAAVQTLVPGEIYTLQNTGGGPLVLVGEGGSVSAVENRYQLPGGAIVLPTRGSLRVRRDEIGKWNVLDARQACTWDHISITGAAMPVGSVSYHAVDQTTGWPGRFSRFWRVQGSVGTELTGISPGGFMPWQNGDEILLKNYASGLTIKNSASAAGERINTPSGGDHVFGFGHLIRLRFDIDSWIFVQMVS